MAENDFSINDALTMRPGGLGALGRIDQYELVRELGGGGFGTVYLARDTVSGVEYAVKGLPPTVRDVPEELENIRANFALVSRLSHTHIARAHVLHLAKDVFYADESARRKLRVESGDTLMVMEYAPGVTLSKWRRQFPGGKVPVEKASVIVRQVAAALDYAHRQRILHRDVKPANVMVETLEDGSLVARVLDFGLAAEIRSSMGHVSREIHDTSGTRPYMAPEQWVGAKQGPATDQYALAALFCELVTGEVPFASVFETNDPMVMLNAVRGEPYVPPSDLPKAMRAALVRALAKRPGKRFASCTAFANALGGAGLRWQVPVLSVLALLALGAVVYVLCGLDFGAGKRNKTQRLKDAAIELRERARLAHEDAEKRGFASDEALARLYREFERCYRAGMESYDNGNYASATNFFERAGEGMRQLAAEKRRLDAVRESAEAQDRKAKEEKGRLTRQFIEACRDERYADAARVVDSIDRDDAEVQFYLGKMYDNGFGVAKDAKEALKWYRKAAEQGNGKAQNNLGVMYAEGRVVAKDESEAVKWYRKAALQGLAMSQYNLGSMYLRGNGVEKDEEEAAKWYKEAASQGYAEAQWGLGLFYAAGRGVAKDDEEAVKWYRKAAENGHRLAQREIGYRYQTGNGVRKDLAQAVKWYRKSAAQGYDAAQFDMGVMCYNGWGIPNDYKEAVSWFRKAAEQGNRDAQYSLGIAYENGNGVGKDEIEAVKWYRKSAEEGHAKAQREIGWRYQTGNGVEKDLAQAVKWYRKSAEQGYEVAQCDLGFMYENGLGVATDETEAVKWYRKGAEQGNADAQYSLGVMYDNGRGVTKDAAEAARWYRRAAEQGDVYAQNNLGLLYEKGSGVTKDYAEAVKWYRKAAEQSDASGEFNLGDMYEYGKGVEKDKAEAIKWYRKAAEQGHSKAKKRLDALAAEDARQKVVETERQKAAKEEATRLFIDALKEERYEDAARLIDSIDRDDSGVQHCLGAMYSHGAGVPQDDVEAVKWTRKSAERGRAGAQFDLGVFYANGKGVAKDDAMAVEWYRRAAEQGHAGAQCNLGVMYDNGRGVTKDEAEAARWYRRAAEQGDADAQFNLGVDYDDGCGVEKNKAEAIKWYRKAAEQGHDSAKKRLASLTSAQVPNTDEKDASRSAIRAEGAARDLAENSLREALASRNIQTGYDHERRRTVAIGTESFSLKDKTSIDERNTYEFQKAYDFPDDPNDDFEMKRFKAMWKAYANAVAASIKENGRTMTAGTNTISLVAELTGVTTLQTAASSTGDKCGIAVAVSVSAKRGEPFSRNSLGELSRPGPLSISEFIQEGTYEDIVPRVYVDNHGNLWRIASVPIDLSVTRGAGIVKKNAIARQYAFEAALRTLSVRATVSSTLSTLDYHEDYSVRIEPLETVSPNDDSRVKWFALDRVNPLTSNSVRVIVCAICSEAVSRATSSVEQNDVESVQAVRAVPSTKTGQKLKTGDTKTISLPGGATMEMIYVAPGTFKMGSPAYEWDRHEDESRREIAITKGFWLGKYEVTQKQWRSVMEDNPSHFVGDDLPVENVSWDDCQQFIKRVNAQLHCGARLPTEVEWECACRAGTTTAYFWGDKLNGDKANCDGNWPYGTTEKGPFLQKTAPVGSYAANPWGFYDMHGNVYEWCEDWYDGEERVLRGSGWYDGAQGCRSSCRYKSIPRYRSSSFGFRLACSQVPVEESRPTPVAQNEIDGQSLGSYCNTFKGKDGDTPVVVSTAWGVKPRRLIHAEDLKNIEDYRNTNELVSRMLAENNIQDGHDVERGRIVTIGTWGFSMGGGASDVDETNYEIDCGFPDSADDSFEMKRFKAMWKAYAQALAEIVRYQGEKIESSETETNSATKGSAMPIMSKNSEIHVMASMRLAGVTFLAMAESWAGGEYEVSVAMCQSAKRKESYSSRSTGIGSCRGRYSIFEWLERVSKIGMICPQAYCDKDGVWWRVAGVPFGPDGKRFKMKDATMEAKHCAYEAALRTIEVQVALERRLTSVTTEKPGGEIRVDDRLKEHIKIDPLVAIPPLSIMLMDSIDPLTGKSVRLAVAFLSENDPRILVRERAGGGSSR